MKPLGHLAFVMAVLWISLAMVAGCHDTDQPPATPVAPAPAASAAVDSYQAMALVSGKSLVGRQSPTLAFKTLDGQDLNIGPGQHGRPVYLKFWATWCVTCREQMGAFKADWQRYRKDMDIVAVNTGVNDDLASIDAYRREVDLPMRIAMDDGRLAQAFHLKVTPQHVVIDRNGIVRYVGHLEDERLHEALQAAVANLPPPRPEGFAPRTPDGTLSPVPTKLFSVQGREVSVDGPAPGAPRLLYFFSPWCEGYLKDSRPTVARECRQMREALVRVAHAGVAQVVGIASGLSTDADGVRRFLDRTGFQAPVVVDADGKLFRHFQVTGFPVVILLDGQGRPLSRLKTDEIEGLVHGAQT